MIEFYPNVFLTIKVSSNTNTTKKLKTAFLFHIFGEMCRYLKVNINNEQLSPKYC